MLQNPSTVETGIKIIPLNSESQCDASVVLFSCEKKHLTVRYGIFVASVCMHRNYEKMSGHPTFYPYTNVFVM